MIWIYGLFFVLATAKWLEVAFLSNVSWWWILLPLFAVVLWFEVFERMVGMDKQRQIRDSAAESAKRKRINEQLGIYKPKKRR